MIKDITQYNFLIGLFLFVGGFSVYFMEPLGLTFDRVMATLAIILGSIMIQIAWWKK